MSHNMSHKMSHIKPIKVQVCEEDYCNQIGSEDEFMPSVECELPVDPTEPPADDGDDSSSSTLIASFLILILSLIL